MVDDIVARCRVRGIGEMIAVGVSSRDIGQVAIER
jgi:hypothetical protein